eukprot:CAMPEP_0201479320 /NCGR_PEP_ID=MMETSP0151_2-20130828/4034_1 /ASSEMBLY_ACC=CAM_ASM_000257 /TAXON_ID=200890 /ORGANISM="Paramoeba atlantica, Strain 621/1 / CCAP 1560/9" /LENGTH=700 /DNA_ID=CAMNT_0047860767 /DNA_START=86 /DNA_END=2188 /DNA_ORIENTATION=+
MADEDLEETLIYDVDFADLELESEIDSGCFGAVYKGLYCGTPVAIKRLFDCENVVVKKLMKREISALRSMRHPNIVQFMGTCEHEKAVYIITEFVDGGTLWNQIKNQKLPLPWAERVKYSTEICQAILYLHKKKFIHRDLKSKNMLIDSQSKRLKLCDFGFARTIQDEKAKYMTKTGTGLWMAPEIVMGNPYSEKADIFSFGVILLELIIREKPPLRLPIDHFGFNIPNLKRDLFPRNVPPPFVELFTRCTQVNPEHRPSAEVILNALKSLLGPIEEFDKRDPQLQLQLQQLRQQSNPQMQLQMQPIQQQHQPSQQSPKQQQQQSPKQQLQLQPTQQGAPPQGQQPQKKSHLTPRQQQHTPPNSDSPGRKRQSYLRNEEHNYSDPPPIRVNSGEESPGGGGGGEEEIQNVPKGEPPSKKSRQKYLRETSANVTRGNEREGKEPASKQPVLSRSSGRSGSGTSIDEAKISSIESLSDVYKLLYECAEGKCFSLTIPLGVTEGLLPIKARIEARFLECLSTDGGSRKSMVKTVKLPAKTDKTRWIATNIIEHVHLINQLFMIVTDECTAESCPTMSVSRDVHFPWGDTNPTCQEYVGSLNSWLNSLFEQQLFPTQESYSKKTFLDYVAQIQRKSFRLFCHIHFAHWKSIQSTGATKLFKLVYSYVWHFNTEFKLIDKKNHAPTLIPMEALTREIKELKGGVI